MTLTPGLIVIGAIVAVVMILDDKSKQQEQPSRNSTKMEHELRASLQLQRQQQFGGSYMPMWMRRDYRRMKVQAFVRQLVAWLMLLGAMAGTGAAVLGWFFWRLGTELVLGACLVGIAVWWWYRREHRRHLSTVVEPLYAALRQLMPLPAGDVPRRWLTVPHAFDEDTKVRLKLPKEWLAASDQQKAVTGLIERRLPGEWEPHWNTRQFTVEYRRPPKPPGYVSFSDVKHLFDKGKEGHPILGLGTRGETIAIDFDAETPHVGMSMGTGAGKSTIMRSIIAFQARFGTEIDIINPKREYREFEGIPGIRIHNDIQSMWDAIARVRAVMEQRQENPDADYPRHLLINDEQNMFAAMSYEHYRKIKQKGDPAMPPVFSDLAAIYFQGRSGMVNVVGAWQQMNARSTGGSELRDQFGMKIMARFSPQAWGFLVGTYPRPRSSRHKGRAIVLIGDDQRMCQLVDISAEEAREYALNGRLPQGSATVARLSVPGQRKASDAGTITGSVPGTRTDNPGQTARRPVFVAKTGVQALLSLVADNTNSEEVDQKAPQDPELIVGRKAAAEFLKMTESAFSKARQRDPIPGETRIGQVPAWTEKTLRDWHYRRPRAGARDFQDKQEGAS